MQKFYFPEYFFVKDFVLDHGIFLHTYVENFHVGGRMGRVSKFVEFSVVLNSTLNSTINDAEFKKKLFHIDYYFF